MEALRPRDLPQFRGTRQEIAKAAVNWMKEHFELRPLSDEQARRFSQRTVREIFQQRQFSALAPCLEMTIAAHHLLRRSQVPSNLVVEDFRDSSGRLLVHFGLEVSDGKKPFYLDFIAHDRKFVRLHPEAFPGVLLPEGATRGSLHVTPVLRRAGWNHNPLQHIPRRLHRHIGIQAIDVGNRILDLQSDQRSFQRRLAAVEERWRRPL